MNKEKFVATFTPTLPTVDQMYKGESLLNSPDWIVLADKMLKAVFPDFNKTIRTQMMLGGTTYKNRFGGISGMYATNAIQWVFNTIVNYYDNQWWAMGMDKASVNYYDNQWWAMGMDKASVTPTDITTTLQYTQNHQSENLCDVFVYQTPNAIFACLDRNFFYTCVLLRKEAIVPFMQVARKSFGDFKFNGIEVDCEDVQYIGNGYAAIIESELIEKLK